MAPRGLRPAEPGGAATRERAPAAEVEAPGPGGRRRSLARPVVRPRAQRRAGDERDRTGRARGSRRATVARPLRRRGPRLVAPRTARRSVARDLPRAAPPRDAGR